MKLKNKITISTILILTIILLAVTIFVRFDNKDKTFEISVNKSFGLNANSSGSFILPTKDKGCILTGYTQSYSDKNGNIWLIKISEKGTEEWNKTYGGNGKDYGKIVFQKDNNSYFILGTTNTYVTNIYGANMWFIKVDQKGNEIWNKTYGGVRWDEGNSLTEDGSGNFLLVGSTASYSKKEFISDAWLVKVNKTGHELWNKTFGGEDFDEARSIVKANDESYIICGFTKSYAKENSDAWAIKVNSTGHELWNYTYGFEYNDRFNQVIIFDDGFVFAGHTEKNGIGDWCGYIVKTDFDGKKEWELIIDNNLVAGISSIVKTSQGFLAAGYIGVYGEDNLLVVKVDNNGKKVWQEVIDAKHYGAGVWIDKKTDDDFVIAGYMQKEESAESNIWFLEIKIS
jgi:hypothetical protein